MAATCASTRFITKQFHLLKSSFISRSNVSSAAKPLSRKRGTKSRLEARRPRAEPSRFGGKLSRSYFTGFVLFYGWKFIVLVGVSCFPLLSFLVAQNSILTLFILKIVIAINLLR